MITSAPRLTCTALSEKVLNPAWQSKPSWLIADANDRMVPPQYEKDTAKQIHAKLTILAAGHVPMLSMPDRVAAMIVRPFHVCSTRCRHG
jgi:pimeloyl-ACP methyl ester carboxylesterase